MSQDELLEQIRNVVHEEIKASEERLAKKIDESQEDTIKALSDLIHTGYNRHEERLERVEKRLGIPRHE